MAEPLTKENLREALRDVVADRAIIEPLVVPIVHQIVTDTTRGVVIEVCRDKFERVLGVDCMDAEARAESRKNHEFSEKARKWFESPEGEATKADLKFVRSARTYFDTQEGAQRLVDAKRIAGLFDKAAMNVGRFIVYAFVGGIAFFVGSGVVDPTLVKRTLQAMGISH